jgi:hypothetical protein
MNLTFVQFLLTISSLLLVTTIAQDYDALTNIQLGMEGLMKAGSDPAMLAQLMQDMQVRSYQLVKVTRIRLSHCLNYIPLTVFLYA